MECACGHPIVWKKDMSIVVWNGQTFYLHTECFNKYIVVEASGHCIPTLEFLDIINKKRTAEEAEKVEEVTEAVKEPEATPSKPDIKCPNCGGQAAYSAITKGYVCLDCQTTLPVPEPSK